MKARLVECTDHKVVYGVLTVLDVSAREVQDKIYEIKNDPNFYAEYPDWVIKDVLSKFPKEWSWQYTYIPETEAVIEI